MGTPLFPMLFTQCAIEFDKKLLVIRRPIDTRDGGLLAFPGGKIDQEDCQLDCDILQNGAKREILEEVGISLDMELNYVTSRYFNKDNIHMVFVLFHCVVPTMPKVIPSAREVANYYWMNREEIDTADESAVWLKKYSVLIA
jgi:8-oxo-dGTP pyrophosphatase MutT (NUDIX family)